MVRLLECFGFDVVLLETVGAGQGDTAVRHLADVVVLLLQPQTGDDLQWEKAGVLEVADVLVLHKADLPGADEVEAQVKSVLGLGAREAPPLLRVSSRTGSGVAELWQTIHERPRRRQVPDAAGELLRLVQKALTERFARSEEQFRPVVEKWQRGEMPTQEAIAKLFQFLSERIS
jgi:putative protein kinase ArgK-like GTPase of G3E family